MLKENWERAEAPFALDITKIDRLMKPVFGGKQVIAAERIGTGLSNSNYKVRLEGIDEPYVLRLYRGGEEIAGKEFAISQRVKETVPVPEVVYADMSRTKLDNPWAVLEWKEGLLLKDVMNKGTEDELASAASSAGSVLARIHRYTFDDYGFLGADLKIKQRLRMNGEEFLRFIEQSLFENKSGKWIGEDLTKTLWDYCKKHAPALSENNEAAVLAHSDYNGLNVLVLQNNSVWSVSAVLDWEFAFAGSRYVDIANMLRYEENDSIFERHFIRAYEEQGVKLAPNWKLLSRLEDLVALCDMLNHSTAKTPNRIHDLQRLIQKTVASR